MPEVYYFAQGIILSEAVADALGLLSSHVHLYILNPPDLAPNFGTREMNFFTSGSVTSSHCGTKVDVGTPLARSLSRRCAPAAFSLAIVCAYIGRLSNGSSSAPSSFLHSASGCGPSGVFACA